MPQPTYEQAMGAAIAACNAGQPNAAMAICADILQHRPADPAAHQLRALLYLQSGQPILAQTHIQHSLQARPGYPPALLLAGKIARALDDLAGAADLFNLAAAHAPTSAEPAYLRGLTLLEQGHKVQAAQVLQALVLAHPQHAAAWFQLGVVRQDMGELPAALAAFQAAMQHQPGHAEAAVNLGIVLQELGRLPDAMQAYRQAYRLRSDTFGRIAQALTSSPHGALWLDQADLRTLLA